MDPTATPMPWHQSKAVFAVTCLLFPPAGLVLLWMRPGRGLVRKAGLSLGLAAWFVAHLVYVYGLRVEVAGSGMRPMFTFHDPVAHIQALEASRGPEGQEHGTVQAAGHAPAVSGSAYWTDYRGPGRDGHYQQTPIRTDWPENGLPELWRQKVGGGYASVVVAEGRVFTIEQRRREEVVACYDFATGRELWTNSWTEQFQESMGGPGPRATPTWHEGKVYALGAAGELRALDAHTGKVLWRRNILSDNGASNLTWAVSGAPLVLEEETDRASRRTGGQIDRRLPQRDGRADLAFSERQTGLHLSDAGHPGRETADRHGERATPSGGGRQGRFSAVGLPLEHVLRRQLRPAVGLSTRITSSSPRGMAMGPRW